MNIVENKKIEILNKINLGALLENAKPSTFKGQDILKYLVENFNGRELNITDVAKISTICQNLTEDVGIFTIGESITETLSVSLDSVLIYTLEGIERRVEDGDRLAEGLKNRVVALLEMDTLSEQQNAIRNGYLNAFGTIYEGVGLARKMCEIKSGVYENTSVFEAYNPIVFTERDAKNTLYLKLQGVTFGLTESKKVFQSNTVPSQRFVNLSNTVSELKYITENNSFVYENRVLGKFEINENEIKHNDSVVYETNNEFSNKLGVIVESVSENQREKQIYRNILESLLSTKMNFDSFIQCDNIVVVENKQNGDKFAIFVMESKAYMSVLKSVRYPQTTIEFNSVSDVLEHAKAKIGYDATSFFENKLVAEKQNLVEKQQIVSSFDAIISELNERKDTVIGYITEAKANNENGKIQKLEETLSVIESLIVEQTQNKNAEIIK